MSDLRNSLIKLAYEKKELREDLLPLLKTSSYDWNGFELEELYHKVKNYSLVDNDKEALEEMVYETGMLKQDIKDKLYERGIKSSCR